MARLLAAGVDWNLTEHLLPTEDQIANAPVQLDEGYTKAKSALYVNQVVVGQEGTAPLPLGLLVAQQQPLEAMAWLMEGQSHGRPSPLDEPRWLDILKDGSSPASYLATQPDILLEGIRRRWFCRGSFAPNRFPGLSDALDVMMANPDQVAYVTPLLEEISTRFAGDVGGDFGVNWRKRRLDRDLPEGVSRSKPRF